MQTDLFQYLWQYHWRHKAKIWTNFLHDLLHNPKCSSQWYKKRKIEDQSNRSPLKVSAVMINTTAITIDSDILLLSEVVILS